MRMHDDNNHKSSQRLETVYLEISTVYLLVMIFVTSHELNNNVFINTTKQSFSSKAACLQAKNKIESDVVKYG